MFLSLLFLGYIPTFTPLPLLGVGGFNKTGELILENPWEVLPGDIVRPGVFSFKIFHIIKGYVSIIGGLDLMFVFYIFTICPSFYL